MTFVTNWLLTALLNLSSATALCMLRRYCPVPYREKDMKKAIVAFNTYSKEWKGCNQTTHAEMAVLNKVPYMKNFRSRYWKYNGKKYRKIPVDLVVIRTSRAIKLGMSKQKVTYQGNNMSFCL